MSPDPGIGLIRRVFITVFKRHAATGRAMLPPHIPDAAGFPRCLSEEPRGRVISWYDFQTS